MRSSFVRVAGPTPHSRDTGSGARNACSVPGTTASTPSGLARSLASLARNFVEATPTDQAQAGLGEHPAPDRRRDLLGLAEQPPCAGDVEERLVDRELLDERRDRREDRHDLAALLGVARHARREERRLRARLAGAGHRHRRVHAERACLVAGGADDAPVPEAADDDRLAAQRRVVELLDRREERVEVDVQDRSASARAVTAAARHDGARTTRMSSRVVPKTS